MPLPFDIEIFTKLGVVAIERKIIPEDLISSVTDGRLYKEIVAMREVSKFNIILFHGSFRYNRDNTLWVPGNKDAKRVGRSWTKKGIKNLCRTLEYVETLHIEWANDSEELVEVVAEVEKYFNQVNHLSLKVRPGLHTDWLIPTRQERIQYFYQGLPSISAIRAKALTGKFPSPMNLYSATVEDFKSIPGIGDKIATGIYNFLREG